jgi:hypothetical protein
MFWSVEEIENEQKNIRAELDKFVNPYDPKLRLAYILQCLERVQDNLTALGQLRAFTYLMAALVQHLQHGGLTRRKVAELGKLGELILRAARVPEYSSKIGFLHGNLRFVLSRIQRSEGKQWASAWNQLMASRLARRAELRRRVPLILSNGVQMLRLGHAHLAQRELEAAENLGLDERQLARARIERVKSLRLLGDFDAASSLTARTEKEIKLTIDETKEFEWEKLCRQITSSGNIDSIVQSVMRRKPHCEESYVLEAFLWICSTKSRQWLLRFPTLKILTRGMHLNFNKHSPLYKAVQTIEECYDNRLSFNRRLLNLGDMLKKTCLLFTIDAELLVWCASVRWLARNRCYDFLPLVFNEYEGLCIQVSKGKIKDVLGMIADADPWCSDNTQQMGGVDGVAA